MSGMELAMWTNLAPVPRRCPGAETHVCEGLFQPFLFKALRNAPWGDLFQWFVCFKQSCASCRSVPSPDLC